MAYCTSCVLFASAIAPVCAVAAGDAHANMQQNLRPCISKSAFVVSRMLNTVYNILTGVCWGVLQSGKTNAERLLDRYYNEWNESVDPIYQHDFTY